MENLGIDPRQTAGFSSKNHIPLERALKTGSDVILVGLVHLPDVRISGDEKGHIQVRIHPLTSWTVRVQNTNFDFGDYIVGVKLSNSQRMHNF